MLIQRDQVIAGLPAVAAPTLTRELETRAHTARRTPTRFRTYGEAPTARQVGYLMPLRSE